VSFSNAGQMLTFARKIQFVVPKTLATSPARINEN